MAYGASYLWDFGDGETSTEEHPTHVYTNPGIYTVSLTVTLDGVVINETKIDYIVVENTGDIILQAGSNMQYFAEYLAYMGGEADSFASAWNTTNLDVNGPPTFSGNVLTWAKGNPPSQSVITTVRMPPDPANGAIEFKFINEPENGLDTFFGVWVEGFGPPFNPDDPNGGSVVVGWVNNGNVVTYGGESTIFNYIVPGDVVGMVADLYTSNLNFFKNGVYQFQLNVPSPTIWPIVALRFPPS